MRKFHLALALSLSPGFAFVSMSPLAHSARAKPAPAPQPMTMGLPIKEGVWVNAKTKCGSAQEGWVYHQSLFSGGPMQGNRGSVYELIDTLSRVKDGFTRINGGPMDIKPLADGRAVVRVYSLAEGEVDRSILHRCELGSLSPAVRANVERSLAAQPGHDVYIPGRANGSWGIITGASQKAAQFSGDGLIETLAMTCMDGKEAGPDKVKISLRLRRPAPVTATRLALIYHDGGGVATFTSLYYGADDSRWFGPADDGIVDTLDISSRIIIDLGPAGAEEIPLTGSSAAIREALAPCWRSRR